LNRVLSSTGLIFEASCDVLVIGAGAAGLIAALRAREAGADVLVLERDKLPRGSTALSAGLIPAAETRFQREAGISDSKSDFAADIMAKAHGEPDPAAVACVVNVAGEALEWLADRHGLPFSVISNFSYPGHSAYRMHGLPGRSGAELMDRLRSAAERAGITIVTEALADILYHDKADGRLPGDIGHHARFTGVGLQRPDGTQDRISCKALVLACNGYGGSPLLVASEIPEIAGATYFGHTGNQGDALIWGRALDARMRHLSGYQGHGSVAHPHGILITWATITEGGFQVNLKGKRFANEAHGYSESAAAVLAQPQGQAWTIFDGRIAAIARQFEDFRQAEAAGAIQTAGSLEQLAAKTILPVKELQNELARISSCASTGQPDAFGRIFEGDRQLHPPFHAVRVTGALFHTQGGLEVDTQARVMSGNGVPFSNLFAAGGAACGVSGSTAAGYLSGNGLLTAVSYGYIAGASAACFAGTTDEFHGPR
jgi:fumarate reductase flavoprotein subunit